jgi:hypothetical protein
MGKSQNRSAPSSLFLAKKEGLGALGYGTPVLRHSQMHNCLNNFSFSFSCGLYYMIVSQVEVVVQR